MLERISLVRELRILLTERRQDYGCLTSIKRVRRESLAYSSRYIAAPIPIGNAKTTTKTPIQKVPRSPSKMP